MRPLFEDSEARVVNIPALLLVGCIGLCDAFGQLIKTIDEAVELLLS